MREESLTSLAILKVNWDDKGHDYVENFVPFVVEALKAAPQDQISVTEVQVYIRQNFGLLIPQGALNTLLRRAERRGYVRWEHRVCVRNNTSLDSNFERTRSNVRRQQEALISKLIQYCQDQHGITWSLAESEEALLSHLQNACIPILIASVDGCAIPLSQRKVPHAEYVISAFVIHLHKSDPEGFTFLETVLKGSMLANALILPDISKTNKKFKNLSVYLDTKVILRALGLEGENLQAYCEEFLALLYESNINLYCFDITLDELRGILDAAQCALKDTNFVARSGFLVYEHFVSKGLRASDVELIIADLERSIKKLHVRVKASPPHAVELGLNEEHLSKIIKEELPFQRLEAQRHDIDCLTAIHRLRKAQVRSEIETCDYVFVTTNNSLATASAKFCAEEYERSTVPLCVNDYTLATLAWVKNPTIAADFSRNRLIADSYAALQPSSQLWKKYSDEISRLQKRGGITEDDYHLLRFSIVARNALLQATLGSPDAFTEGTVPEILEAARADARREAEQELARKSGELKVAEERAVTAESALKEQARKQRCRIKEIGNAVGIGVRWVFSLIILCLNVIGILATVPSTPPQLPADWLGVVVPVAIAVMLIFTAWNLASGGVVRALARIVETWSSQFTQRVICRLLRIGQVD